MITIEGSNFTEDDHSTTIFEFYGGSQQALVTTTPETSIATEVQDAYIGDSVSVIDSSTWLQKHGFKLLIACVFILVIFAFFMWFMLGSHAKLSNGTRNCSFPEKCQSFDFYFGHGTSTRESTSIHTPVSCSTHSLNSSVDLIMTSMSSIIRDLLNCRYSSTDLVHWYFARIDAVNRQGPYPLFAVIETNPDALTIAATLDQERHTTGTRSPLHGIPIIVKDNVVTDDQMQTTAGSLALVGSRLGRDAHVIHRLRQAGAIILGKASLDEWSNFRSSGQSRPGWSARGGMVNSAYVVNGSVSGSSGGSAVAVSAGLCACAIGTDTGGSVTFPASFAGIVGLRPTVGLVSRSGVIPISRYHDTVGPMCRTVEDVALLLEVIQGIDERDNFTQQNEAVRPQNYTQFLRGVEGLQGLRLGVFRHDVNMVDEINDAMNRSIKLMSEHGAIIVDSVNITALVNNEQMTSNVWTLYREAFREDIQNYLDQLTNTSIRSLTDIIKFNFDHSKEEFHPQFAPNQFNFEMSINQTKLPSANLTRLLNRTRQWGGELGIDAVLRQYKLDAIILADGNYAIIMMTSAAGYPLITVPLGYKQLDGQPFGLFIAGTAWSEPMLLRIAHGFEQGSHVRDQRRPPYAEG